VPYRGTAPALNDLIASHVDIMFVELGAALQLHRGGKMRILAATTERRVPTLPDIPTMKEAGLDGIISDTWNAISAPPKTPPAIVAKLNTEINEVLKMPDVRAHLTSLNLQPEGGPPAALAKMIAADTKRWTDVVRIANVTITAE
jgi:tripartite-type tricarboxylate transporter receptor subunit TctC